MESWSNNLPEGSLAMLNFGRAKLVDKSMTNDMGISLTNPNNISIPNS